MRGYILAALMGIMLGWAGGVFAATESVERRLGKLLHDSRAQTEQGIANYDQLLTGFVKLKQQNEVKNEKAINSCVEGLDRYSVLLERQTATLRRIAEQEAHAVR